MTKKQFLLVVVIALILTGGTAALVMFMGEKKVNIRTVPVIYTPSDNEFTLKANSTDTLGVKTDSTFTITSKNPVALATVKGNLVIEPKIDYQLESADSNTFTLVPRKELQNNTIYKFSMVAKTADQEKLHQYKWAYQTRDSFKIINTLPRNMAVHVPLNSGIEITFSHENFQNYEEYVTFSPSIEGRFEQHRKTLVYVPNSLSPATVYTVSIRAGLPLVGSDQTLAEDYSFQFETDASQPSDQNISFSNDFFEYPASEAPVLTVQSNNEINGGVTVKVYAFSTFDGFKTAVDTQAAIPNWAYYSRHHYLYPVDSLQLVTTFQADLTSTNYYRYFNFPEALNQGFYLVRLSYQDQNIQTFLQITNLTASFQGSANNSFIWVHQIGNQQPIRGAAVHYSANNDFGATTNDDGLAQFTTPAELRISEDNTLYRDVYFTVEYQNQQLLVPAAAYNEWGGFSQQAHRDYWSYFYTNRTLYSPTDSIKFWGLAKSRSSVPEVQEVTVKLIRSANYIGENQDLTVREVELPVSSFGTFDGSFDFSNLTPGSYYLHVEVGGNVIVSRWVEINSFEKPAYKIEVSTPSKAIFEGEDAVFNIKAEFFDGTPVTNLALAYTGALGEGSVTTDDDGMAQVRLTTQYSSSNYYPVYQYFSVHPVNTEISNIYTDAYVYTFGPHLGINGAVKSDGKISGTVYQVDLSQINANGEDFVWNYQGDPAANVSLRVKVYHEYYTKSENGTWYDYINKKTYKTYSYQNHSDLVQELSATSGTDGTFASQFEPQSDWNYKVEISALDSDNRTATTYEYLYRGSLGFYGEESMGDSYHLLTSNDPSDASHTYQLAEQITATLYKNDEALPNTESKSFVFFKGQRDIFDLAATTQSSQTFRFQESYLPNIYLYGLYFDGRNYHLASALQLNYDQSQKDLNITMTTNKETYRPGEQVNMQIRVTDKNNTPVQAAVNVSAIDEALTAIQWENPIDVLDSLYAKLPLPLTYSYESHKSVIMPVAEGGGCFTGETLITMSDRTKKMISDVKIGDTILTRRSAGDNSMVEARVSNKLVHLVDDLLVINNKLKVTPEHIIFVNGRWQAAGQVAVGDYLTDESGSMVRIESIQHLLDPVRVYNLQIQTYHTFFANGIYVHNEKSGGRNNFQNIAYFGSTTTNRQGHAEISFQLPDNITSWQTTIHAATQDLKAHAMQTGIIATQPYFVDVAVASNYLVGDTPTIKLRSFGTGLGSENVTYAISYPGFSNDVIERQGAAHDAVEITLPNFTSGQHTIRVEAHQGNNTDTVSRTFTYADSNIMKNVISYYELEPSLRLTASGQGQTDLVFTNKERGQYYNNLRQVFWTNGDRVDQKLGRVISQDLLHQFFQENFGTATDSFNDYQVSEGGISLLPYSSGDLLLTAKALEVAPEKFDTVIAQSFFENIVDNPDSNLDQVVYSLFGLANLHQPVLTEINLLLENPNVTPELKLYLARAVANLGATEYASTILEAVMNDHGVTADPYIKINLGTDQDDYTEYTYQAAIVAAAVSSDQASKLYDYATHNPAKDQLNILDQLVYLKTVLPLLSSQPVSFTYMLDGQSHQVELANDKSLSLSLNPEQLGAITFSGISGQVGLVTSTPVVQNLSDLSKDPLLSVSREYSVNNHRVTTFHENDVVKVTLHVRISDKAMDNDYQLTDHLPAGLRVLSDLRSRNISADQFFRYPYLVDGQTVKFWTGKLNRQDFYYYAIVTGKGGFKAEAPMLQGFVTQGSINYGDNAQVSIQ